MDERLEKVMFELKNEGWNVEYSKLREGNKLIKRVKITKMVTDDAFRWYRSVHAFGSNDGIENTNVSLSVTSNGDCYYSFETVNGNTIACGYFDEDSDILKEVPALLKLLKLWGKPARELKFKI